MYDLHFLKFNEKTTNVGSQLDKLLFEVASKENFLKLLNILKGLYPEMKFIISFSSMTGRVDIDVSTSYDTIKFDSEIIYEN